MCTLLELIKYGAITCANKAHNERDRAARRYYCKIFTMASRAKSIGEFNTAYHALLKEKSK